MTPKKLSRETIDLSLSWARTHSDMPDPDLRSLAMVFCRAHETVPGGLTIEIGTRAGGTALLFAELLIEMYRTDGPAGAGVPPLWTVDPYGSKPYEGGDGLPLPLYHDADSYLAAKKLLSPYAFHTHWKMEALEFFAMERLHYWEPGPETMVANGYLKLPIGVRRPAWPQTASFILLDGEHTALAIEYELRHASTWLKPGGLLVIDNIDADPETRPMLEGWSHGTSRVELLGKTQAVVRRVGGP